MSRTLTVFTLSIFLTFGGCFGAENSQWRGTIYINEFMASNSSTIIDEQGDYDDWIELYNRGDSAVDLGGMYLTDNFSNLTKWKIPDTTIAAGGFLIFWADGQVNDGPLHTNFKLSANGEGIGLYDTDANKNGLIDVKVFEPQKRDTSYGRYPDGENNWQFFSAPTPGSANAADKNHGL